MKDPSGIRAFIALEMPDAVRDIIRREQRALKAELPWARWTRPESQHLTLKFLGEMPEPDLATLAARVRQQAAGLRPVPTSRVSSGEGFDRAARPATRTLTIRTGALGCGSCGAPRHELHACQKSSDSE